MYFGALLLSAKCLQWSLEGCTLCHYTMSFFVSRKNCHKVCLHKASLALLITICLLYIFPSFLLSMPLCLRFKAWLSCRWHRERLLFSTHSVNICLLIGCKLHVPLSTHQVASKSIVFSLFLYMLYLLVLIFLHSCFLLCYFLVYQLNSHVVSFTIYSGNT